jgi:hypothetical protein
MLVLYHLFGLEKPLGRVPDGEKVIREFTNDPTL